METPSSKHAERPGPRRRNAALDLLRRNRNYRLLYVAQLVSFAGDWFLFVAIAGLVFSLTHSPGLVASLIAAMTIPFAVFTFVGGPLADRLNRQALMIVADLLRGVLALGFFLVRSPSEVWLVFVLAGAISALGALFEPASQAAVPNLVDLRDLATANILSGSAWGTMLAAGAGIGGLVVAAFGRGAGYVGDAASFFVSASLLSQIHRPFSEAREKHHEHPSLWQAVRETGRYARQDHRVMALLAVKGGFGFATGVIGLLPVLALGVYHGGDRGTGILYAFRGLGAFVGPFLARPFIRENDLRTLFWSISTCLAVYGLFYALVPWMPTLWVAGVMVMGAHLGGGGQWTLSTYGLQLIVPDRIRGRVFAFDYGLVTFTLALSAAAAGWAADFFDPRKVMLVLACVAMAYSVVWTVVTKEVRRSLRPGPPGRGAERPAKTPER
jgi:predicted MFS family arabinose efflux permease